MARTQFFAFAIAAVLACSAASASAAMMPVGIFPSPPVLSMAPGTGSEAYLNLTVHLEQTEEFVMDVDMVAEALVGNFLPFFWGEAPCHQELSSADLSSYAVEGTAVVAMPDPLSPTMHMFIITLSVMGNIDIDALPHVIRNCAPEEIIVDSVDHPVLHANKIAHAAGGTGIVGVVDGDRSLAAPQQRGTYYMELMFASDADAQMAAARLNEESNLALEAGFLNCINNDNMFDDAPRVMVNSTFLHYAAPMGSKVAIRLVIDNPYRPQEDHEGDDMYYGPGMEYDPMFALRGELIAMCTDALMYHAMFDGYNGPGRKAWSWQDFNKDLCGNDFFDNGATFVVESSMSEYDSFGFDMGGNPTLFDLMARAVNDASNGPEDHFTPAHVSLGGAAYNGTHAIFRVNVHFTDDEDEWFPEDPNMIISALAASVSASYYGNDVYIAPFPGGDDGGDGGGENGGGENGGPGDHQETVGLLYSLEVAYDDDTMSVSWWDGQALHAVVSLALSDLNEGKDVPTCPMCMNSLTLNYNKWNETRAVFRAMLVQAGRGPGTAIYSGMAFGHPEDVMAFKARLQGYPSLNMAVNPILCATGAPCASVSAIRSVVVGEMAGVGMPGGWGRPGARALFRVYGADLVSATFRGEFAITVQHAIEARVRALGSAGVEATVLGCAEDPRVWLRAAACEVEVVSWNELDETSMMALVSNTRMAIEGYMDGTSWVPSALNDFYPGVKVEMEGDMNSMNKRVWFTTTGRAATIPPQSAMTAHLQDAASAAGAAKFNTWQWGMCVGSGGPTACFIDFEMEDGEDMEMAAMRAQQAVNMAVMAARPTAMSLSFRFGHDEFRVAEPAELLTVAPRMSMPNWEGGMVGHLDFTFTEVPRIEELAASSTGTALRVATTAAIRENEHLDFLHGLQVADVFIEAHQYGPDNMYTRVQASFDIPAGAPDAHMRLQGARRDVNNEIPRIYNNVSTCGHINPRCNGHFFKYMRMNPTGPPDAVLATDDCWAFFYDCNTFEMVNSRQDGSGRDYWLVPDYRRKFDDTFLQPCGCDVPGVNPEECGGDPPPFRRLSAAPRFSITMPKFSL